LSDSFKYALVAGAVTGGGLTIIANAPNPAGIAILRQHFDEGAVHPLGLLLAAITAHTGGCCFFLDLPIARLSTLRALSLRQAQPCLTPNPMPFCTP
jgi:hypothetical protein